MNIFLDTLSSILYYYIMAKTCRYPGCSNPPIKGKKVCPSHVHGEYKFNRNFSITGFDYKDCRSIRNSIMLAAKNKGVRIITKIDGNAVFVWIMKKRVTISKKYYPIRFKYPAVTKTKKKKKRF